MKIKYLGPIPLPEKLEGGMWVNVHPYGQHDIDTVKEYPDDFGKELIATSKTQNFKEVIDAPLEAELPIIEEVVETNDPAPLTETNVKEKEFTVLDEDVTPIPTETVNDANSTIKGVLDAMGVPEDKIDTASFEPEPVPLKSEPKPIEPEKKVVPRIPTLKPKNRSRNKRK